MYYYLVKSEEPFYQGKMVGKSKLQFVTRDLLSLDGVLEMICSFSGYSLEKIRSSSCKHSLVEARIYVIGALKEVFRDIFTDEQIIQEGIKRDRTIIYHYETQLKNILEFNKFKKEEYLKVLTITKLVREHYENDKRRFHLENNSN